MATSLYFIAIEIPDPVKRDIQLLKEDLSLRHQSHHSLKTPIHLTLLKPTRWDETREGDIINALSSAGNNLSGGFIRLNNLSSFPPRTVFVDVKPEGFILDIYQAVGLALANNNFIQDTSSISAFHPHITLMTRDLSASNYSNAIKELEGKSFRREVYINSFQLFKHNGKKWEVIKYFALKPANI